ncbi:DUF2784 domain-containing protein [Bdellovibrio reynosensis]|uniref:DUF2784 domain-containing protein n=1 Tax=Bdellovibrio reynosensis TaxID=2835041 RepID=A0ABY4CE50_9BACT|nr:DUF2784 domain-containing protein [Bdellovibrio reynosensis]UOF00490.1 DUF2784 domain-containing protein [Bdellovibrio reynosensis]
MSKTQLADLILYFHFLYVVCVITPVPLILIGAKLHWRWIRIPWLRRLHVAMILFVVVEYLIGMMCPLTVLEEYLRQEPGQKNIYPLGFFPALISKILFSDFEPWVYGAIYITGASLIVLLYRKVPPRP